MLTQDRLNEIVLERQAYEKEYGLLDDWNDCKDMFYDVYGKQIGEYNDAETRQNALNSVSIFCIERGFTVICDESNNPPELIEQNGFAMTFTKNDHSKTYTGTGVISEVSFGEVDSFLND